MSDLQAQYKLAARPFLEAPGPVPEYALGMRSWRYVIEFNSACNLRCSLCMAGQRSGYNYTPGTMDMKMAEDVLDKAKAENPNGVVCVYLNSEPFLHPRIDEIVAHVKRRGLKCEISTNLHTLNNVKKVLDQKPDLFTVSVSGFSQETYQKAHRRGDIELVKKNIIELASLRNQGNTDVKVNVSYHLYLDNLHEVPLMEAFVNQIGLGFMQSWARTISMENTVQALRHLEVQEGGVVPPYELGPGTLDLNKDLPPISQDYLEEMKRLKFPPQGARKLYERFPVSGVCLIADVFTCIRHDGTVQLCAWTDDMRMRLGNFLEMSQEQISAARQGHPFCKECLRYRTNLYYHIIDCYKWDTAYEVR